MNWTHKATAFKIATKHKVAFTETRLYAPLKMLVAPPEHPVRPVRHNKRYGGQPNGFHGWFYSPVVSSCRMNRGVRQSLGRFIPDMLNDTGWTATTFGLAFAIQNLMWGISAPIAGALADRFGTTRTLIGGAALYAAGLYLMGTSTSPSELHLTAGFLIRRSEERRVGKECRSWWEQEHEKQNRGNRAEVSDRVIVV